MKSMKWPKPRSSSSFPRHSWCIDGSAQILPWSLWNSRHQPLLEYPSSRSSQGPELISISFHYFSFRLNTTFCEIKMAQLRISVFFDFDFFQHFLMFRAIFHIKRLSALPHLRNDDSLVWRQSRYSTELCRFPRRVRLPIEEFVDQNGIGNRASPT